MQDNLLTRRHYVTEIVTNYRTGHELRTPIGPYGSGVYHSMIYAGTCARTGHDVIIDQDDKRTPGFRRIEPDVRNKLDWGKAPSRSRPGLDVLNSASNEVFLKDGCKPSYNLVRDNCQHFVSRHLHGVSRSRQINDLGFIGMGYIALAAKYMIDRNNR